MSAHTPDFNAAPASLESDPLPGPWLPCGCGKCGLVWSIPADYCVADVCGGAHDVQGPLPVAVRVAHQRIIAAAPDLLDVARDALAAIGSNDSQRELALRQVADRARAAIALATK